MNDILPCTVTHQGVPIGTVDLELLDAQGLGTLTPLPAYSSVRPRILLAGALGRRARVEMLTRQMDDVPSHPIIAKAALSFELVDQRGAAVPADVVRLVELRTRPGVTVLVDLRSDAVGERAIVALPLDTIGDAIPLEDTSDPSDSHGPLDHQPSEGDG